MAQDQDVTLKLLLLRSRGHLLNYLVGGTVQEWLNVELPRVNNLRVDLLARLADGRLVHIELQTQNDPQFARRQAQYYLDLQRLLKEDVHQVALYVGREPLRMSAEFRSERMWFRFDLMDIRDIPGEPLLASEDLADNLLAVLADVDQQRVVRRVLERVQQLRGDEQVEAVGQFVILSGLRDGAVAAFEEARRAMPSLMEDLVEHDEFFRGLWEKAKAEGLKAGLAHERSLLSRLMEKRFGALPAAVQERLQQARAEELENWGLRILDARTLEEVFHP